MSESEKSTQASKDAWNNLASQSPDHPLHQLRLKKIKDREIEEIVSATPLFSDYMKDNPDYEALRELQAATTPQERAEEWKDSGNLAYKLGKARWGDALMYYTQAIEEYVDDNNLNSALFANRSQVLLALGNYGKALKDAQQALEYNRENIKAYFRAARAAQFLKKWDIAIRMCQQGLDCKGDMSDTERRAMLDLQASVTKNYEEHVKELTKQDDQFRKRKEHESAIESEIALRGIQMKWPAFDPRWKEQSPFELEVFGEPLPEAKIEVLESQEATPKQGLYWPVLFAYPEYLQTDFIQRFHENHSFADHLNAMFPPQSEHAPWDERKAYSADNLNVYLQVPQSPDSENMKLVAVPPTTTLLKTLQRKDHQVPLPVMFAVVAKDYDAQFREDFRKRNPTS